MTDHQIYIARDRSRLHLRRSAIAPDTLFLSTADSDVIASISIPTAELLAMIDAADPDAMRAYLRETAPEVIADLYRPEVPEADSPEDVDERPDVDQARAAGEQLGKIMRAFGDAYAEAMKR